MSWLKKLIAAIRRLWNRIFGSGPAPETLRATVSATPPGPAPGVGVCLSGGGSRALVAGLGQLRALSHLQANGQSLLEQVAALSTVSGGSWLGVPWVYLPSGTSDADYLNGYVADPGRLVLRPTPGHSDAEVLDHLPPGNAGANVGRRFEIEDLLFEMIGLKLWHDTPWNMMWQVLVARHLLHPYGLYSSGHHAEPQSLFSLDRETLERDVIGPNPALADATAHLVADPHRPFLVCNTSMFVRDHDGGFELLAPVQANSRFTGILGEPDGVDANGRRPGGGGVTSFAFSSALDAVAGEEVTVTQTRQFALTDIVGASSAAFAETLQNLFEQVRSDPKRVHAEMKARQDVLIDQLQTHAPVRHHHRIAKLFHELEVDEVERVLADLSPRGLVPRYRYWPVRDASPEPDLEPTHFADGGSLENTGIGGLLAHREIDRIIAFVNSSSALGVAAKGVVDEAGHEVPGTRIAISSQVSVLFGYQAYDDAAGYVLYDDIPDDQLRPSVVIFRHSHVFESTGFAELLKGLWSASGNESEPGSNQRPAIYRQTLTTVSNPWFRVEGGRQVEVVWYYLNMVEDWRAELGDDVRTKVDSIKHFPHYNTFSLQLDPVEVNLMSNLTAWSVGNDANAEAFVELFERPGS